MPEYALFLYLTVFHSQKMTTLHDYFLSVVLLLLQIFLHVSVSVGNLFRDESAQIHCEFNQDEVID